MSRVKLLLILSLATLCASAYGANSARPGTINYIEGSALVAGASVTQKSVGTLALDPGQVLSTEQGHAEVLLTPGIYLRLDDDSSVRMISPDLTSTQVALDKGAQRSKSMRSILRTTSKSSTTACRRSC
jgi:hypothetical protein